MTLTTTQKALIFALAVVALVCLAAAALGVARWGFARAAAADSPRSITVSDSAQVKVQPDTAFVTFGVVNKDRNARNAARANAVATSTVAAAIEKAGIPRRDVKTVNYSLEPEIDWQKQSRPIVGYTASNSVTVRTKNLAKIGDLIDAAISAGANNVQGVQFSVEDQRKFRRKALSLAVKKAEGKAQAIAEAVDAKLGPARSASESVSEEMPYARNYVAAADAPAMPSTPISPGEATVSAEVRVVYELL